jgi:hypothetical protein
VVHQYAGGHCAHDLMLDALRVDDQMMDVQMIYVLGDLLLDVHCDHCAALKYEIYRLLALVNENVRILELQRFHQLAFQRVA